MFDLNQENTNLQNRRYPNPAKATRDCHTAAGPSKPAAVLPPLLMTMAITDSGMTLNYVSIVKLVCKIGVIHLSDILSSLNHLII